MVHEQLRSGGHMAPAMALRATLLEHSLYRRVNGAHKARVFMEWHVFAVWDFMSLLKALQRRLTCVELPWIPPIDRDAARLINEIVLAEESDVDGRGRHAGHYDLYVEAMSDVGADTTGIARFVNVLRAGRSLEDALVEARVPAEIADFVRTTLDIAQHGKTHEIAAAFFFGRENVIPAMFDQLRASLHSADHRMTERLSYYLSRHIEMDGEAHGPAAEQLLESLCDDGPGSPSSWAEANTTACRCLRARIALWDGVARAVDALDTPRR
jgi:hypothetical protein